MLNAAALTITEATLEANAAGNGPDILATSNGGDGGAIQNTGTLTVTRSTLVENRAGSGGSCIFGLPACAPGGNGGAISSTGTLTISAST